MRSQRKTTRLHIITPSLLPKHIGRGIPIPAMSSCSHLVWLVLLAVIPAATGLPNGAPLGACVTMSPKHNNTNVQPSKSPYSLVVESVDKDTKTRKGGIYIIRSFDNKLV